MLAIQSQRSSFQKPTFGIKEKGEIEVPGKVTQTYMPKLEQAAISWQVLKK